MTPLDTHDRPVPIAGPALQAQVAALQAEVERLRGLGKQDLRTVTETPTRAWAHCPSAFCDGNRQVEVEAIEVLITATIGQRGDPNAANAHLIENSWTSWRFANPDELECEHCGRQRELADTTRPEYDGLSGHPQHELLRVKRLGFTGEPDNVARDEVAQLRAQVERLTAQLARQGQPEPAPAPAPTMDADTFEALTSVPRGRTLVRDPHKDAEPDLPAGVRRRESGTFQAFWRKDGRQHQQGGFETADEAAEYRAQQLEDDAR